MKKRMIIMLVVVAVVLGGVFGFQIFKGMMIKKFMAGMGSAPQTVSTIKAEMQEWQPEIKALGTLRAARGVELTSEVAGIVDEIHFESGQDVEEGTLLVQLRSQDEMARLHALQAAAKLAEITWERDQKQLKAQAISQATVDVDAATLAAARAQVAQQRAVLEKKMILAPFTGRIGIRAVDVGQYLNAGTSVATLQQVDPIYFDFALPQQFVPQLKVGQKLVAKADAWPDREFPGEITAINPKIDPATRNVQIRASLPNPDRLLLPGMFATAGIVSGDPQKRLTLPQTAITFNPYGSTVFVVETKAVEGQDTPQMIASQKFVTTGATRGDQIAILSGIAEGDTVVTAGQMKLRNGSPLVINNSIQPSNDPNPKPEDK